MRAIALSALVYLLVGCGTPAAGPADAGGPAAEADGGAPDAGETSDAGASVDAGLPLDAGVTSCTERNAAAEVAARDGFIEVCAEPTRHPRAVCGDGTPYRFSYRRAAGTSAGLLIYFRGGGNCTDYVTCWGLDGLGGMGRTVGTLSNTRSAPEVLPTLRRTFGLFDRVDPTALFADFDVLYVPYCSGDGGLQSTEQTFTKPPTASPSAPAQKLTYFRGLDNRRALLDWARTVFPTAPRLVVWGSSAGSYSSLGAMPEIADAWPSIADVTWWGEGGVGVGRDGFGAMATDVLTRLDGKAGRRLVRFVQFTYTSDAEQIQFAPPPFFGSEPMVRAELRRLLEARALTAPDTFRFVAVPGACHTLALQPALYQAFQRAGSSWQPVVPAVRPNPELVFDGVSLVALIRQASRGSGPFDASFPNRAPDWALASTRCELP